LQGRRPGRRRGHHRRPAHRPERGRSSAILAEKNNVFARLSPSQKESIIIALQKRGHVVGYMGDGINDAPSMRVADVGISVDTAVDVAKESADIILLEKSLLVLEDGIIEGRKVFGNIIKYIRMGASSNFGNMFSVVGGSYFLPFLPMARSRSCQQPALRCLAGRHSLRPRRRGISLTPRKWNIGNIQRFMIFIGPMSSIFDYATLFPDALFFQLHPLRAPDGIPVRFIVMYFVPESQKNSYLKEISSLAKAITTLPALQNLEALTDLAEARHRLLDAVGMAVESTAPDARARMIRLETRHAQSESAEAPVLLDGLLGALTPLSIVSLAPARFFVLSQNDSLVEALEKLEDLPAKLLKDGTFTHADLHVVLRSSSHYKPDRTVHDCLCYSLKRT
jgi:hypothetical protein